MANTILIVEDERIVRDFIAHILRKVGHNPVPVENSRQAAECCGLEAADIELAIVDLTLAGESGTDAALTLLESRPTLKILFTSGAPIENWSRRDIDNLSKLPHDSYSFLLKPFPPQALLSEVAALLRGHPTRLRRTA